MSASQAMQSREVSYVGYCKEYKYVQIQKRKKTGQLVYCAVGALGGGSKLYPTAREAAIQVDKMLIRKGKKPVNILKPSGTRSK